MSASVGVPKIEKPAVAALDALASLQELGQELSIENKKKLYDSLQDTLARVEKLHNRRKENVTENLNKDMSNKETVLSQDLQCSPFKAEADEASSISGGIWYGADHVPNPAASIASCDQAVNSSSVDSEKLLPGPQHDAESKNDLSTRTPSEHLPPEGRVQRLIGEIEGATTPLQAADATTITTTEHTPNDGSKQVQYFEIMSFKTIAEAQYDSEACDDDWNDIQTNIHEPSVGMDTLNPITPSTSADNSLNSTDTIGVEFDDICLQSSTRCVSYQDALSTRSKKGHVVSGRKGVTFEKNRGGDESEPCRPVGFRDKFMKKMQDYFPNRKDRSDAVDKMGAAIH